ncbi:MAG: TolC family protein [Bdellovibrionaceae bacterium]|nr:TolC family protein [Pseudobdellovibrionaceae bacterium]
MVNLFLFLLSTVFAAEKITLSQKDVAELVLKQGPKTKEVSYKYEQSRLPLLQTTSLTDWKLLVESGYEHDRNQSLTQQEDNKYERYITTVSLSKLLLSGTSLTFQLGRTSQKANVVNTTLPPQSTMDNMGLTLEQSLLGNFFGQGDRAKIAQADYTYKSNMKLRTNELQDVVLSSLQQFWNTYVAQENFRESMATRERYEKLVSSVRRKNSLGYANPGELSQIQAEYEGKVQEVKTASQTYLQSLDDLNTLLALPPGTEVDFIVPKELPPVPKLSEKPIDNLRPLQSQNLLVSAAKEGVTVAESNRRPTLNLVGKYNATGVDDTGDKSYAELSSGNHPKVYAGLKFQYNFGSGVLPEDIRAKKAALSLEETKLTRIRNELRDRILNAERRVGTTYTIAQSSMRQREFSQRAVTELTRSYNQGRTDIRFLIDAMNLLYSTEVQAIRALGDYQIALNEWAAARDELIPDQKEENP